MEIKRGIAVSAGVAIGPALVVDNEGFHIPKHFVAGDHLDAEVARLRLALKSAAAEARNKERMVRDKLGRQYAAIFAAHALLIEDAALIRELEGLIRDHEYSAEYAVSRVIRRHVKTLESLDRGHFASRSSDLVDIEKSVLHQLVGHRPEFLQHLKEPVVVLARDLTPTETAGLDPQKVHAFVTEAGGRASHTAIMAGVLEIPAVVGVGRFLGDVSGGDEVIVDGNKGVVILNPDEETRARYEQTRTSFRTFETELRQLRDLPAVTRNDVRIQLHGNIEFPEEAEHCIIRGADGVGLYRTEFLYLNRQTDPIEQEHFDAYYKVIDTMGRRAVIIRTLDLGADKFSPSAEPDREEKNPFLGLRSIRLCLRNLALFKTQMRAILRASHYGDVRIMFPMVSTLLELRQCKMILAEVKEDLEDEGVSFNPKIPVGTMIEVPSAAIMADQLAREVNFFSIGTNDLIQYTLAADRTNETVASLYNPGDPAVLRLIDIVVKAANRHQIEVSVCGEMSGDPLYTMLLLGLGLRQLSVTPHNIPEIKKVIRSISIDEANDVAQEALQLETARDVNNFLRDKTRRVLPEVIN